MKELDEYLQSHIVQHATYLQKNEMDADIFTSLHHFSQRGGSETDARTLRHFGKTGRIAADTNRRFAARLHSMVEGHQAGRTWAALRDEALRKYPL